MRSEVLKRTTKQSEARDTPDVVNIEVNDLQQQQQLNRRAEKRVQSHQDEVEKEDQQQNKRTRRHLPSDSILFDEGRRRLSLQFGETSNNNNPTATRVSDSSEGDQLGLENGEGLDKDSAVLDQWNQWQRQLLIYDNLRNNHNNKNASVVGTIPDTLHNGTLGTQPPRVSFFWLFVSPRRLG